MAIVHGLLDVEQWPGDLKVPNADDQWPNQFYIPGYDNILGILSTLIDSHTCFLLTRLK